MPDTPTREPETLHQFKNCLAIVVGFSELLVAELPAEDPRRADIEEIYKAGRAAMALLPDLIKQIQ